MLEKYRNIIIGVGSFIIFVFLVQFIFVKSLKLPDFIYSKYEEKQIAFNSCYGSSLKETQKSLETFIAMVQNTKDAKDIKHNSLEFLQKTACNVSFVTSNDAQIRIMAIKVYEFAKTFYERDDIKLLNTVYTSDEQFSAILQTPRSYLFYGMLDNENTMVAFLATPQKNDSLKIEALWDKESGTDNAFVQNEIQKLLTMFNQKIF